MAAYRGFVLSVSDVQMSSCSHDSEWYALHAYALTLLMRGTVVVFVRPVTVSPLALAAILPAGCLFLSRVVANFHRRG
jgi:hypothetical protein